MSNHWFIIEADRNRRAFGVDLPDGWWDLYNDAYYCLNLDEKTVYGWMIRTLLALEITGENLRKAE